MKLEQSEKGKLREIQSSVCRYYKLSLEELTGPTRPVRIAHPRMLAMFLAWKNTNLTLCEIGEAFGKRDHGTVIHAREKIKKEIVKRPKELGQVIEEIMAGEDPAQLKMAI